MKLTLQKSNLRQIKADAVVIFIPEDKNLFKEGIAELKKIFKDIEKIIELENFKGKSEEIISILTGSKLHTPRLYLTGVGNTSKLTLEQFRRAAASTAMKSNKSKIKHLAVALPKINLKMELKEITHSIAEGMILSIYSFDKYFTEKKNRNKINEITFFDSDESAIKELKKPLAEVTTVCEAVYLARNLSNAPSNEIYPETLSSVALESGKRHGFKIIVWDKKKIQREGFGGLLGVNSGSEREPRFIILDYNSDNKNLDTIVLIGKGVTFDSGGISIKPSSGMSEMKMDMAGAAAVIGTVEAAARLKLPVRLVGLIPATENMPGGSALKPGDIIKHYGGKTSEVDNTDAEGRLILADAIAYAANYKPKAVIDLATLTGACVVALGQHATGMFGNDEELMTKLKTAGEKTFERVWQLPIYEEYEKQIKSEIADVKNVGGKWAGAITAALFLKKFIPKDHEFKWVHLDIAGTAILEENLPYTPKPGSGVGVRLLIEFLKNWK